MNAGSSIFLIAVGAILRYALDWQPSVVDLRALGLILMLAGAATMVVSMIRASDLGRRHDAEHGAIGLTRPLWHIPSWSRIHRWRQHAPTATAARFRSFTPDSFTPDSFSAGSHGADSFGAGSYGADPPADFPAGRQNDWPDRYGYEREAPAEAEPRPGSGGWPAAAQWPDGPAWRDEPELDGPEWPPEAEQPDPPPWFGDPGAAGRAGTFPVRQSDGPEQPAESGESAQAGRPGWHAPR